MKRYTAFIPKTELTPNQRAIIERLNHPLFTVEFIEEWLKSDTDVYTNAPAFLSAIGALTFSAYGFYTAVKAIEKGVIGTDKKFDLPIPVPLTFLCTKEAADEYCGKIEECPDDYINVRREYAKMLKNRLTEANYAIS